MKRFFVMLGAIVLIISTVAAHGAENKLTITIEDFERRFNEGNSYMSTLLSQKYESIFPKIGLTDGADLISFEFDVSGFSIRGNAYPDSGVVSSLMVLIGEELKTDTLNAMKMMSIMYALSARESFASAILDQKFANDFEKIQKGKPFEWNGYQVTIDELDGVGGWASSIYYEYAGKAPVNVPNAKGIEEYLLLYSNVKSDSETILSSGEYVVGQHISSGEYSIKAEKNAYLGVKRNGSVKINESLNKDNEIGRAVLKDGDSIEISGGKVVFTPIK